MVGCPIRFDRCVHCHRNTPGHQEAEGGHGPLAGRGTYFKGSVGERQVAKGNERGTTRWQTPLQ